MSVMLAGARRLGETAARLGLPATSCPYDPAGSPPERAAAHAWVDAYLRWRPTALAAVSYDDTPTEAAT